MADSESKLGREILAEATKQADQAVAKAQKEAESLLAAAQLRQEARRAGRLAAAESSAADQVRTRQAVHEVDKRRRQALNHESIIQAVLDRAADQVRRQEGIDRTRSLLGLLTEAVAAVESQSLTIRMSPGDIARVGEPVLLETARRAAGSGAGGALVIVPDPALDGGVVVESADGLRRFDNGPAARGRRLAKPLRPRIARDLGL